jgi:hypothetical protein
MKGSKLLYPLIGAIAITALLVLLISDPDERDEKARQPTQASQAPPHLAGGERHSQDPQGSKRPSADPVIVDRWESRAYAEGYPKTFKHLLRDEEGNLSQKALRDLGVSEEHVKQIASLYQAPRLEMAEEFKSRIEADKSRSDPEKSIQAFKVKSAAETGDKISSRFKNEMGSIVGAEMAETIYDGLTIGDQLGCFGRQEIHLKMIPSEESEIGYIIKADFYEPKFMVSVRRREIQTWKELHLVFGTAFDK